MLMKEASAIRNAKEYLPAHLLAVISRVHLVFFRILHAYIKQLLSKIQHLQHLQHLQHKNSTKTIFQILQLQLLELEQLLELCFLSQESIASQKKQRLRSKIFNQSIRVLQLICLLLKFIEEKIDCYLFYAASFIPD